MSTPTFRDLEQLSAYLDGQLSRADRARLDTRLAADPDLRAALDELGRTRDLLRKIPARRAPRNFTLTPRMAGIRPPVPRAVPALGWASAVSLLLFVCTLATNLVGRVSLGPMAAAPKAVAPAYSQGLGGGPAENAQPPASTSVQGTPTPEASILLAPQAATPQPTAAADMRTLEQTLQPTPAPVQPAPFITRLLPSLLTPLQNGLIALAAICGAVALIIYLFAVRFWKKSERKADKPTRLREILLFAVVLVLLAVAALSVLAAIEGTTSPSPIRPVSIQPVPPSNSKNPFTPDRFSLSPDSGYHYAYTDGQGNAISIDFPAGAFEAATDVQISVGQGAPAPEGYAFAGVGFQMYTVPESLPLRKPVSITIQVIRTGDSPFPAEGQPVLLVWTGSGWSEAAETCNPPSTYERSIKPDTIHLAVCAMEGYALFAPAR